MIRDSFESFFKATLPDDDYSFGVHTRTLIAELQITVDMLEGGESRYLCVCMPYRHGKSDIVSRRFPIWFLIRNPDREVILASYNHSLATDLSYDARRIFMEVGKLFGLRTTHDRKRVDAWRIDGHLGAMFAAGLNGTITGRGAHVLVIDDYLKGRAEAESEGIRDKIWDSFGSDLMTRLAPVHAVVIVANRWHEDDLVGRIINKNNPDHDEYDPKFPRFELIDFPAWDEQRGWLFPERFDSVWYERQKAQLGSHAWNAQAQQDPQPKKGNLFHVDQVQIVPHMPEGLRWIRGWDIAATEQERTKHDPDWTVGAKVAIDDHKCYISDIVRGRWSTLKRNEIIRRVAIQDKEDTICQKIEVVALGVDTFNTVKASLREEGIPVRRFVPKGDKVTRAACIEPICELGNLILKQAAWNATFLNEMSAFPMGKHDDQIDAVVTACWDELNVRRRMGMSL